MPGLYLQEISRKKLCFLFKDNGNYGGIVHNLPLTHYIWCKFAEISQALLRKRHISSIMTIYII